MTSRASQANAVNKLYSNNFTFLSSLLARLYLKPREEGHSMVILPLMTYHSRPSATRPKVRNCVLIWSFGGGFSTQWC